MCSTTASGVACCENCRGELEIVCKNGCPLPDPVFKNNPIAVMPRGAPGPRTKHGRPITSLYPTGRKSLPGICTYRDCPDPIAPREPHTKGRPHTKCEYHLAQCRKWSATHHENVARRQPTQGANT